jgi:hypothetical protein
MCYLNTRQPFDGSWSIQSYETLKKSVRELKIYQQQQQNKRAKTITYGAHFVHFQLFQACSHPCGADIKSLIPSACPSASNSRPDELIFMEFDSGTYKKELWNIISFG